MIIKFVRQLYQKAFLSKFSPLYLSNSTMSLFIQYNSSRSAGWVQGTVSGYSRATAKTQSGISTENSRCFLKKVGLKCKATLVLHLLLNYNLEFLWNLKWELGQMLAHGAFVCSKWLPFAWGGSHIHLVNILLCFFEQGCNLWGGQACFPWQ